MDFQSKPIRRKDLVWREVDGETVIIAPDNKYLRVLNSVGSSIWSQLDGRLSVQDIVANISSEYGVDTGAAQDDVLFFIRELHSAALIEK
jgi:hypothetical protein